jgi:hypothetical protein
MGLKPSFCARGASIRVAFESSWAVTARFGSVGDVYIVFSNAASFTKKGTLLADHAGRTRVTVFRTVVF